MSISLLDCTLRDGAYIVNSMFGTPAIKGIISSLDRAHAEIIECGWLKNDEHKKGSSFYHVPADLAGYINRKNPDITYAVMIDYNRYDTKYLPVYDGKTIDAVRVVFPKEHILDGINIAKEIKDKGYRVMLQAANTLSYSEEDLKMLSGLVNSLMPESLSVVDTFGAMYEEDLDRITDVLDANLDRGISLGLHSHNNQQLSFALSMHFIKKFAKTDRNLIVDSSLCGMGRGAGNTTTELLAGYLNSHYGAQYDLDAVMNAIDVYMSGFSERYFWGYSTPYFISGLYCCHVNNIAYLLDNHRSSARDMRKIIESLDKTDRVRYDYDLLERKFTENHDREVDDESVIEEIRNKINGHPVFLIAPGKTSGTYYEQIRDEIRKHEGAVVIAVNALLDNYEYDYLFLTNSARYIFAADTRRESFDKTQKIMLSCIRGDKNDNSEKVVRYSRAIKRGWDHFDNSVICALRFLGGIGIEEIYLSGFDGFKNVYYESYADEAIPAVNPGKAWNELNEEIADMFADVKSSFPQMEINFLTPSIFS